jgi:hypothetical protein
MNVNPAKTLIIDLNITHNSKAATSVEARSISKQRMQWKRAFGTHREGRGSNKAGSMGRHAWAG